MNRGGGKMYTGRSEWEEEETECIAGRVNRGGGRVYSGGVNGRGEVECKEGEMNGAGRGGGMYGKWSEWRRAGRQNI